MEDTLLRNPHVGEILQYEFLEELYQITKVRRQIERQE